MPPLKRIENGKIGRQWVLDNFSVDVIGKLFEDFMDNAETKEYDFEEDKDSTKNKKNNPDAFIPNIESNSDWVLTLYRDILAR